MWPIVVVILSVPLLKQPIGRVSLAGIAVSFFGVLVISTRGDLLGFSLSDPIGTALAVGSAFIWAAFWLSNVRDDRDEVVKLLVSFVFGLAFVSAAAFALAGPPPLDPRGIGGSVYVGMFEMGVTFVLWMRALSLSRTTAQVSNLVYLSPFLSLALISVIVGETILPSSVVGLVSRAERNQAVWRSKSVPLERRCSAKMSAYDGCRREPLVAARLVEPMRQGNRWLSAW